MPGSFTCSTGDLGVGADTFGASLGAGLATLRGALAIFGAGLVTLGAGLATLGVATVALGLRLDGFAAFLAGFRNASMGLTAAIGSGAAATGGMGKGAKISAMDGFDNSRGAVPPFKSAATLM